MSDNQPPTNSSASSERSPERNPEIASQKNLDKSTLRIGAPPEEALLEEALPKPPAEATSKATTPPKKMPENEQQAELELSQLEGNHPKAALDETASNQPATTADSAAAAWENLDLPGTLKMDTANVETTTPHNVSESSPTSASTNNIPDSGLTNALANERETELLTLIHDLNDCNDVLLSRVSQIESDLEKSQSALKTAVEKAAFAQDKMAKQVSAGQASAQQVAQNAQQQVAKLVSKLEANEQAFSRQQLINENLQTELTNSQERITQLERECARTSQQHAEEAQARAKADTTSRDLRSRLQRQQRYTLQFKAALEKSLTVSARPVNTSAAMAHQASGQGVNQPVSFNGSASIASGTLSDGKLSGVTIPGVTMPRAQQIMPWASSGSSSFQGIDPHLETLIRDAGKPNRAASVPAPLASDRPERLSNESPPSERPSEKNTGHIDPEAEAKLWQDLERVMNTSTEAKETNAEKVANPPEPSISEPAEATSPTAVAKKVITTADSAAVASAAIASNNAIETSAVKKPTEPQSSQTAPPQTAPSHTPKEAKLNWQKAAAERDNPIASPTTAVTSNTDAPIPTEAASKQLPKPAAPQVTAASSAPVSPQTPLPKSVFTEPSPWGKPLPGHVASPDSGPEAANQTAPSTVKTAASASAETTAPTATHPLADYLPAFETAAGLTISPIVKPLQTQKRKVGSMSAVELPTFQTAKAGSFKR